MSLKNQKRFAFLWTALGAVMWLVCATSGSKDFQSGMLGGMAGAFLLVGVIRLVRVYRLERDPEKAADYEASLKDERTVYVANKARSMTFAVTIYAQVGAGLLAIYVFDERMLGQTLCLLTCFQCLLFTLLHYIYNKKY